MVSHYRYNNNHKSVRRSRVEIITDILTAALEGASRTRIMYKANLNFLRFDRYFGQLLRASLLEVFDNPGGEFGVAIYKTTEKGQELLKTLKKASELISS